MAAALSGDTALQAAYRTGDCYLAFAKQASAVPQDATKQTHKSARELFKQCVLACAVRHGAEALALRIAQPPVVARDYCGRTAKLTGHLGNGPTLPSITPCSRARFTPYLVGMSHMAQLPIPDHFAISQCRRTAPR